MIRLPSALVARQAHVASLAARGTLQRVLLSLFAATVFTQQIESWSRAGRTWKSPEVVVDALALSYVAKPASGDTTPGSIRVAGDFADAPTIVAYYSLDTEESAVMLRDMSWLADAFGRRGLRVVAISIDGTDRAGDVRAEMKWRSYPYEWVIDTPEHAARISTIRDMPMGFLVINGRIVHRSFGIDQEHGRTIWGGMRVQRLLDELLPAARYANGSQ